MTIARPACHDRRCRFLTGVAEVNGEPRVVCSAFPKGIPLVILEGRDPHAYPLPAQTNTIVYEHE